MLIVAAAAINHSAGLSPDRARSCSAIVAVVGLFVLAGATPAALGLLADVSERFPHDRGAIMGLYSVFLAIGQITGSLLGGAAAQVRGIDGLLAATLLLLAIALVPLMRLRRVEHEFGIEGDIDRPPPAAEPLAPRERTRCVRVTSAATDVRYASTTACRAGTAPLVLGTVRRHGVVVDPRLAVVVLLGCGQRLGLQTSSTLWRALLTTLDTGRRSGTTRAARPAAVPAGDARRHARGHLRHEHPHRHPQ